MAIPYPSNPAVGDTFTYGGILYTWTGVAWISTFIRTPGTVGSVAVVAPITNSGTPTAPVIGIDQSALLIGQSQVTNLVSDLAAKASTTDLTNGLALKANLAGGNALTGAQTITSTAIGQVPLTLVGASGQTADLLSTAGGARIPAAGNYFIAPGLTSTFVADFNAGNTSTVPVTVAASTGHGVDLQRWVVNAATQAFVNNVGTFVSNNSTGFRISTGVFYGSLNSAQTGYVQAGSSVGTNAHFVVRAVAGASGNLTEWQNSAGSGALAWVASNGDITARVLRSTFAARIQTNDAQTAVIVSTAAANQSADHLQYQNSVGTVLGGTTANGLQYIGSATSLRFLNYTLTAASASSTTVATYTTSTVSTVNPVVVGQKVIVSGVTPSSYNGSFNVTAIGGSSGAWTFTVTAPSAPFVVGSATGFGTFSVDTGLSIQIPSAGTPGLIIRAVASQAANIFEYRRSDNSLQTYITPAGDFVAPAISAIWSMTSSAQDVTVTALRARTSVASGYRANLQTWENQTTVLAGINSPGKFFTGATSGITAGVGGTIQSIATGANPLVTMASAHGLAVGDVVVLAGTTGGTYNGTFFVATVPASTTFTITSALTAGQAGAAGTVSVASQVSVTARSAGVKGLVIQGAASQTANLFEVQNSAGSLLARVESSGNFVISGIGVTSGDHRVGTSTYFSAALNVLARATTEIGAVVRGQASQTADTLQIQDTSANILGGFSATGRLLTGGSTTTAVGSLLLGTTNTVAQQLGVIARESTTVGVVVRGAASQTADLQQWQNSGGTVLSEITASGSFYVNSNNNTIGIEFLGTAGTQLITANGNDMLLRPRFDVLFAPADSSGRLRPSNDNTSDLGTSGQRWKTLFASGATLNSLTLTGTTSPITLNASVGTSGQVLTSAGAGATPTWTTPTTYTLPVATSTVLGGIELFDNATQTDPANTVTATTGRTYGLQLNASNQAVVNVPWSDTNTTYTFATGSTNGAFSVTPSGGSAQSVPIFGLGTSAYRTVPVSGNAAATEVVLGSDTRLTDARTPLSHTHGNISNAGVISTAVTATNPVKVIIADSGNTVGQLTTTGASNTTFLRGDGTWATPAGGGGSFTGGTLTSNLTLAAGTTTLSPLTFQSGTNLTTVTAGANEYDGTVFYQTSNTNPGRALATQDYYYVSSTDWNPDFSASSSAKSLLGAATRGITVAAGTTYEFELYTTIQHDFVTTSGVSASVDIFNTTVTGSPVVSDVMFVDFSSNTTGFTTSATMSSVRSTTAVTVSAAISSGSRYTIVKAKGIIRITGTGTTKIYPGMQTTSASGDNGWTIGTGTTFKMTPIGNGTVTTVGTWA